jgi:hypothetical protein
MKTCSICRAPLLAKGLCQKHYDQQPRILERKRKYYHEHLDMKIKQDKRRKSPDFKIQWALYDARRRSTLEFKLKRRKYKKQYRKRLDVREKEKNYYQHIRDRALANSKKYYASHKLEYFKKATKRHRELGWEELNLPFPNSEFHHITKEKGTYVPHKVHRAGYHCVKTGEGMEEANVRAFTWLLVGSL